MKLYPHQLDACRWLWRRGIRGLLALEPGLGKTAIVLRVIAKAKREAR